MFPGECTLWRACDICQFNSDTAVTIETLCFRLLLILHTDSTFVSLLAPVRCELLPGGCSLHFYMLAHGFKA
jgi:hypothetical protein